MPVVAVVVGLVILGVVIVALLPLGYNVIGPRRDARLLSQSDRMFLDHYCARGALTRFRGMNRRLPSNPRCKLCYVPFGGLGRLLGIQPSRKNSNFCRSCFEAAPIGGYETEVGVLFADARGFTAWATTEAPTQVAAALNRFYRGATSSLMTHDAIIDKYAGDEVMAIFISDFASLGAKTCDHMFTAAEEIMAEAKKSFGELPIGVGLHFGTAWVGNVGTENMKDFTVLGDVVNIAARLQSCAGPGQIVMSAEVLERLATPPVATAQQFEVKGKSEALMAWVSTPLGPHRALSA